MTATSQKTKLTSATVPRFGTAWNRRPRGTWDHGADAGALQCASLDIRAVRITVVHASEDGDYNNYCKERRILSICADNTPSRGGVSTVKSI